MDISTEEKTSSLPVSSTISQNKVLLPIISEVFFNTNDKVEYNILYVVNADHDWSELIWESNIDRK